MMMTMEKMTMMMHMMRVMMEKRKNIQVMKVTKKGILKMILRLMVQEEVMMGMIMMMTMATRKMKTMGKMKRKRRRRKMKKRRLHSHHPRRESENCIRRKLFHGIGFESSLVIRTEKLATLLSKPISLSFYVNDYYCYINISHCFCSASGQLLSSVL